MYEFHYVRALALTIGIETAILWLVVRYGYRLTAAHVKTSAIVFAGMVASAVTLPHVWFVLPAFIPSRPLYVGVAESFAILVEALILGVMFKASLSAPKALLLAVVCNGCSYVIGRVVGL